jgi:hypothetical protein
MLRSALVNTKHLVTDVVRLRSSIISPGHSPLEENHEIREG